ncbi:MAG: MFS transporter [Halobacteriales archaeon]|nr:MFS transporter [Halobacteriales archaeon]
MKRFRPAESDVGYVVASLIAGVFFGGVGGGVAFPTLPALGPVLGISPFLVGIILSANRFTRLLMNTPAGQLIDMMGARRPMILGFLVQGSAPFGYVLGLHPEWVPIIGSAEIFIIARACWGIGSAFVFVGAFSTVTHITTAENRGKWIGYMRGGQSLGFPTGLILGGLVTDAYGYDIAFLTAGSLGLLAGAVAFLVLPNVNADVNARTGLRELPGLVSSDIRIFTVGTVNFMIRFLFVGVLLSTVVLYAQRNGIAIGSLSGTGASGVIMAVSVVFSSATTLLAGRLSDSVSNRALLAIPALLTFAAGFAVIALLTTLWTTLVGVALIGIGVGGTNPPLLAYLGDITPGGDIGKMGGVYNVFGDLGSTLGPLVALPITAWIGFTGEYLACVALIIATVLLVARTLLVDTEDPVVTPAGVQND